MMDTTLIPVLITKNGTGQLLYFYPLEFTRLQKDFANFKSSGYPAGGSYTHSVCTQTAKNTPSGNLWRRMMHGKLKEVRLDLQFNELSIITGK